MFKLKRNIALLLMIFLFVSVLPVVAAEKNNTVNSDSEKQEKHVLTPEEQKMLEDLREKILEKQESLDLKKSKEKYDLLKNKLKKYKKYILNSEKKSIKEMKKNVKELKLGEKGYYGLEEAIINDLEKLEKKDIDTRTYTLYIPNENDGENWTYDDWGTYEGYNFKVAFLVEDVAYEEVFFNDEEEVRKMVMGLSGIGIGFAPAAVWCPYSLLALYLDDNISSFSGYKLELTVYSEQTTKYVLIEDKLDKASLNPYYNEMVDGYIYLYSDQAAVSYCENILKHSSPYIRTKQEDTDTVQLYTDHFLDQDYGKITAYEQYHNGNYEPIIERLSDIVALMNFNGEEIVFEDLPTNIVVIGCIAVSVDRLFDDSDPIVTFVQDAVNQSDTQVYMNLNNGGYLDLWGNPVSDEEVKARTANGRVMYYK